MDVLQSSHTHHCCIIYTGVNRAPVLRLRAELGRSRLGSQFLDPLVPQQG
jgi:hypothetical protein